MDWLVLEKGSDMIGMEEKEPDLSGLDSDQREICAYLASWGDQWVPQVDIAKRAGGKRRFQEDPEWAVRMFPSLVESRLVESNSNGHYRLRRRVKQETLKEPDKTKEEVSLEKLTGARKKILFVDDDLVCRKLVGAYLQNSGYEVLTAQDATEAMVMAEGGNLSLIILDLDLEGESGLMLMKFLKRNNSAVPIILYTGLSHDDKHTLEMLKEGAHQYVQKGPVADLGKAVKNVLV